MAPVHSRGAGTEGIMSTLAIDLRELLTYPRGALVEHLLRTLAINLIAPGVADQRGGL
jgi:hypothetical protein